MIKYRQLCSKKYSEKFVYTIYHTSKCFCECVGTCACDSTPLLKGPAHPSPIIIAGIVRKVYHLYFLYSLITAYINFLYPDILFPFQNGVIIVFQIAHYHFQRSLSVEAVARGCSVKKVFLEISKNLHENTCARNSFLIKLQALSMQLYYKRDPDTDVFLRILQNF